MSQRFLLIILNNGIKGLSYGELDSYEYEEPQDSRAIKPDTSNSESNEEKEEQHRSILRNSSQNRQQLIDLLRNAYNQGWKPNLKHYIPATRFGRHL
ncbi:unnamed protein product [Rotaria sordida]|uniref:Uncharacterized protein n=1 Tax=Rotaria sordida TaxID=392033 RepID=A0A815Q8Y6_9BILA|nr:unnamed protein product [Rotaria sordida]CAF1457295.1 unnamed protein product [Rotaria sordida]CAF1459153.1 unnamed protein product [Rotaria sordida]CAF3552649.1 unnamed protein product [Rotaria sordida]CAF3693500.1 unnamed protein product [Rotaria sordida]